MLLSLTFLLPGERLRVFDLELELCDSLDANQPLLEFMELGDNECGRRLLLQEGKQDLFCPLAKDRSQTASVQAIGGVAEVFALTLFVLISILANSFPDTHLDQEQDRKHFASDLDHASLSVKPLIEALDRMPQRRHHYPLLHQTDPGDLLQLLL